jgi:SWI/SNF-related matrix-associated actin-dependent regulator 1 of chromatin subfamily A
MQIKLEQTKYYKYVFIFSFSLKLLEFCRYIKNKAGWQNFNYHEKAWRFNNVSIIDTIKGRYSEVEIDESVQDDWKAYLLDNAKKELIIEKANKIKTKTTSDLVIKGLKGKLYDFQKLGVEFLINNNGRAILADQMGLGKTIISLAYIINQKIVKTLVVCPSSVKYSWAKETNDWSNLKPFVFESITLRKNPGIDIIKDHDIFIINYDILKRFIEVYGDIRFDCLILDECTYIKSNSAIRTKAVKFLAKKISKRILLSGTPLLNRTVELFNPLQIIDPQNWKNWKQFTIDYCQGHQGYWGWDARGSSNLPKLKKIISPYFLRRKKEEVLPELPPKQFIDIPVKINLEDKFEYDLALSSFKEYLLNIKKKDPSEIKRSLMAETLVRLGELRQITTKAKIETAKEIIQNTIDGEEKIVIFASYNEPLKELYKKFEDISVLILGDTPSLLRQKMIEAFQNKDKVKIFFGGIACAGMGITLTAASNVLFLNDPWVPAEKNQSIDRCHRIGTKAESINIYTLYIPNTIDDYMRKILIKKQKIFDELFEDQTVNKK